MAIKPRNRAALRAAALSAAATGSTRAQIGAVIRARSAELGQVGRIVSVQPSLVKMLLQAKYLPVVSPISVDVNQLHYNVNADDAAGALAIALHAEKLIFVSDVEGVRGSDGIRIPELNGEKIDELVLDGIANGGMIPKLKSCKDATEAGIDQVHICGWIDSEGFSHQVSGKGNSGTIIKR